MVYKKNNHITIDSKIFYRTMSEKRTKTILESGPSFNGGGRFNPKGEFGALYFSENQETSYKEWLRGRTAAEAVPCVTVAFKVLLSNVVQLINNKNYHITKWKESQEVGKKHYYNNIEGIVYDSALANGIKNIVVFPANLIKSSAIFYLGETKK